MILAHATGTSFDVSWLRLVGIGLVALGALRLAGVGRRRIPERVGGLALVLGALVIVLNLPHGGGGEDPARSSLESTGSVTIVEPAQGATSQGVTIDGRYVSVRVEVEDFTLIPDEEAGDVRSGRGHIHFLVDDRLVDMPADETLPDICVPEGEHELRVVLVGEDHLGFANEKDLTDAVTVTGAPGVTC